MYRIELAPGEETVFRTFEELATGVRNGLITPRARIYHGASQKWLPIEFHPHYKRALESPARSVESPAVKPADRGRGASAGSVTPSASPDAGSAPESCAPCAPAAFASVAPSPVVVASRHAASIPPAAASGYVAHPTLSLPEGVALALLSAPVVETAGDDVRAPRASVPHSHGVEAPTATEDASVEERAFVQPVAASQALELPRVSYPEIMPAEGPVAHRPRTLGRSRRPLRLAGAAVALVAGAYAALSVFSARRGDSAPVSVETVADRPAMPAQSPAAPRPGGAIARVPATPVATSPAPAPAPLRVPAPARLNPSQPASSGFAPALEPRALVSSAPAKPAVDRPPASLSDPSLAPAPGELDLAVPALPRVDSLVTTPPQRTDSAMKQILRAVSGGRDIPQQR